MNTLLSADLSSKVPGSRDPALPGKPTIPPHHPHGPPGHPVPPAVTGAPPQPPPIGAVPHPADLLRGAGAAPPLFAPGLPRPGPPGADPLNPFGLPRPPYPSLFGPSPLGGYSTSYDSHSVHSIESTTILVAGALGFPRYGSSPTPFGGLGSLRDSPLNPADPFGALAPRPGFPPSTSVGVWPLKVGMPEQYKIQGY